jgi:hypothetical protein
MSKSMEISNKKLMNIMPEIMKITNEFMESVDYKE